MFGVWSVSESSAREDPIDQSTWNSFALNISSFKIPPYPIIWQKKNSWQKWVWSYVFTFSAHREDRMHPFVIRDMWPFFYLIHVVYIVCRDIPSFVPGSKLANRMCPKNFIVLLTISPFTPNFMILKNVALKYLLVSQVLFSQHFGKRGVCMIVLLWHFVWPLTSQCDDQGSVISDPNHPILKEKSLILSWGLAAPAQMPDSGPAWFPPWIEEYIISSSQINVSGNFELECKFKFLNYPSLNEGFSSCYGQFIPSR